MELKSITCRQKIIEQVWAVEDFYRSIGDDKEFENVGLSFKRYFLRIKLLFEKAEEGYNALNENDRVEVLDALVDMFYVRVGTLLEFYKGSIQKVTEIIFFNEDIDIQVIFNSLEYFGLTDVFDSAFKEVHRSNMSKLDKNGKPIFREDGKLLKGPNFSKPDLKSILENYEK